MTEIMWKVLYELLRIHLSGSAGYASLWHLQEVVKVDLEGCGVPGDPAVTRLLEMGLIVELPDLHYRYRIAVTGGVPDLATLHAEVERLQADKTALLAACKSAHDWMNNEINSILPGETPLYQAEYLELVVHLDTAITQAEGGER